MLLKKYLNLSKTEIFLLIILAILSLLLLLGVKVDKNYISYFFMKIPLQVKGSISLVFWKNYHSVFTSFVFFAYLIMVVEDRERDISRPYFFLIAMYLFLTFIFGLKFGFSPFGKSFIAVFFLLFTLYAYIFFFETVLRSRGIGALFIVLINAFSGLMIYLYNFRDMLLTGVYPSLIEAKYYMLPLYQKYNLNFDFKNLIMPVLLLTGSLIYKFVLQRKGVDE